MARAVICVADDWASGHRAAYPAIVHGVAFGTVAMGMAGCKKSTKRRPQFGNQHGLPGKPGKDCEALRTSQPRKVSFTGNARSLEHPRSGFASATIAHADE